MSKKLLNWIHKLFQCQKTYEYNYVDEVPDYTKPGILYIIKNEEYEWQIVFICPCGCKKLLHINLIKEYEPYWHYTIKENQISLHPSVHRMIGCKSHFYLKAGKIIWVR